MRAMVTMRSLRMEVATTQARVRLLLASRALLASASSTGTAGGGGGSGRVPMSASSFSLVASTPALARSVLDLAKHANSKAQLLGLSKLGGDGWAGGSTSGGSALLLPPPSDVEELVALLCRCGDFDASASLSNAFLEADLSPIGVGQTPHAKRALLNALMAEGTLNPSKAAATSSPSSSSSSLAAAAKASSSAGSDVNHGRKLLGSVVATLARTCVRLQTLAHPDPSARGTASGVAAGGLFEGGGGSGSSAEGLVVAAAAAEAMVEAGLPLKLRLRSCRWGWNEPVGADLSPATALGNEIR